MASVSLPHVRTLWSFMSCVMLCLQYLDVQDLSVFAQVRTLGTFHHILPDVHFIIFHLCIFHHALFIYFFFMLTYLNTEDLDVTSGNIVVLSLVLYIVFTGVQEMALPDSG